MYQGKEGIFVEYNNGMGYREGRNFEYRVIYKLREYGIEVLRNELSRKPDIWTNVGLFEIKKTIKKGKVRCFEVDFLDYIEGNLNNLKEVYLDIKDYFYTLTIKKGVIKLIIPCYMDLSYIKNIRNEVNKMKKKVEFYNKFMEVNNESM
ncbi:MAG: hypothetical protein QXY70_02665 [Nanopusillaceae archaeon]